MATLTGKTALVTGASRGMGRASALALAAAGAQVLVHYGRGAKEAGAAWILEPSATGLCKPDLHVFAKLFEDCLKRGLEAQAFSGREIGGHDDILDFLVGHFVDVDLTRQPAS